MILMFLIAQLHDLEGFNRPPLQQCAHNSKRILQAPLELCLRGTFNLTVLNHTIVDKPSCAFDGRIRISVRLDDLYVSGVTSQWVAMHHCIAYK